MIAIKTTASPVRRIGSMPTCASQSAKGNRFPVTMRFIQARSSTSFDSDTEQHCAAGLARERTPCGAMPLMPVNSESRPKEPAW